MTTTTSCAVALVSSIAISTLCFHPANAQVSRLEDEGRPLSFVAQDDDWIPPEPECPGELDIIILQLGELAPFSGQLFTHDAAACLAQRLELCKHAANAEMERRRRICEVNAAAFQELMDTEIAARDETIQILEDALVDALEEPWYESFTFRVGLGFVVGVGAGYLLHELVN